ncbi:hypothetical protein GF337_11480 [candidate division KSB1 bacterium]|nr:hypothetical protein [candidate division KSB1 bacterium]
MEIDEPVTFCDLHCDTAMDILAGARIDSHETQVNIDYMREGELGLQVFACYQPPSIPVSHRVSIILDMLAQLKSEIENNPDDITMCMNAKEARTALAQNKIGAIFSIENGMAIENKLDNLRLFHDAGIRCLTITHAVSHDWAISTNDTDPRFDGLSSFGEKVIAAMNEMGMIIDLSHSHDRTVEKVLEISSRPVLATHSGVYSLCPTRRNLKDELIKKIADNGGVIGINFYPGFLDEHYLSVVEKRAGNLFANLTQMEQAAGTDINKITGMFDEFRSKIKNIMVDIRVPVDRIIDHVDYVIKLVGDDFVGFGSDFDGIPDFPTGLEDCSGFKLLKQKLIERGYSKSTVDKISHQNFLRVLEEQ